VRLEDGPTGGVKVKGWLIVGCKIIVVSQLVIDQLSAKKSEVTKNKQSKINFLYKYKILYVKLQKLSLALHQIRTNERDQNKI
jgi:hypothetical protein